MISENKSKQQIVKSSAIIGGASVINVAISLIKIKVLALLLGPAGVGLVSILNSIMTFSATLFGMGLQAGGVKHIAASSYDMEQLNQVRRALWSANVILGIFGALCIWFLREELSMLFFAQPTKSFVIGLLSIGVFFSMIAASQTALLQGLRKVNELAKIQIVSALLSALLGVSAIYIWGETAAFTFVIAVPVATALVSWYFCLKLPRVNNKNHHIFAPTSEYSKLFGLGFALLLTGLMTHFTHLFIRYVINEELGAEAVGYFHAAWAISVNYIGFVLAAMATDYYPRLVEIIKQEEAVNDLLNDQLELIIVFLTPVFIFIISFAVLVVTLLYSKDFTSSVEILKWQVFGNIFRVISWPFGFSLLALGKTRQFFIVELAWNIIYSVLVYFLINDLSLLVTGYAFFISYLFYSIFMFIVVRSTIKITIRARVAKLFVALLFAGIICMASSHYSFVLSLIVGIFLTLLFSIYSLFYLKEIGFIDVLRNRLRS